MTWPQAKAGFAKLPQPVVAPEFAVPRLDGRIAKVPPATREPLEIERAVYRLNWLSAAGTAILVALPGRAPSIRSSRRSLSARPTAPVA